MSGQELKQELGEETMEEGSLHSQDSLLRKQCCPQPTAAYIIKTINTDGHRPTHGPRILETFQVILGCVK